MFTVTFTKIENHGSKKWIDFSDINSGKYNDAQLPENYTAEEFSKVKQYAASIRDANVIEDVFILRKIITDTNGNFISIRVGHPENLENWRSQFSSLSVMRDEILQMVNATMTYKDVNFDSQEGILQEILTYSYDQLNTTYFES
jgi:hypothetical protein